MKKRKKLKKLSGKSLTNKMDKAVRDIMRLETFNPICFVCGKNPGWYASRTNPKGCQTGHYISRTYFATRWDMKNVWAQCSGCNKKHNQDPSPFTLRIIEVYGVQRIKYLNKQCKDYTGFTTLERRKMLDELLLIKSKIDNPIVR